MFETEISAASRLLVGLLLLTAGCGALGVSVYALPKMQKPYLAPESMAHHALVFPALRS